MVSASKDDKQPQKDVDRDRKPEPSSGFGRIPKVSDKLNNSASRNDSPRPSDRERIEREKIEKLQKERDRARHEKEKLERDKERIDRERLDKLKAIERDIDRLNKDREKLEKAKSRLKTSSKLPDKVNRSVDKSVDKSKLNSKESLKQDVKKNIDLKSQNTYRIDKNSNERKLNVPSKNGDSKYLNGHSNQGKPVPKQREQVSQNGIKDKALLAKQRAMADGSQKNNDRRVPDSKGSTPRSVDNKKAAVPNDKPGPSKQKVSNSFDFDKHVNSLGKNGMRNGQKPNGARQFPPGDVKRKAQDQKNKKRKYK